MCLNGCANRFGDAGSDYQATCIPPPEFSQRALEIQGGIITKPYRDQQKTQPCVKLTHYGLPQGFLLLQILFASSKALSQALSAFRQLQVSIYFHTLATQSVFTSGFKISPSTFIRTAEILMGVFVKNDAPLSKAH